MKRRILTYGGYFEAFMNTLKGKVQEKIQYGLLLLKPRTDFPRSISKVENSVIVPSVGGEADILKVTH